MAVQTDCRPSWLQMCSACSGLQVVQICYRPCWYSRYSGQRRQCSCSSSQTAKGCSPPGLAAGWCWTLQRYSNRHPSCSQRSTWFIAATKMVTVTVTYDLTSYHHQASLKRLASYYYRRLFPIMIFNSGYRPCYPVLSAKATDLWPTAPLAYNKQPLRSYQLIALHIYPTYAKGSIIIDSPSTRGRRHEFCIDLPC